MRPRGVRESWTIVCLFVVAVTALGQAVQSNNGAYDAIAFRCLNVTMIGCLLAALLPALEPIERGGVRLARVLVAIAAMTQFATLLSNPLAAYLSPADPTSAKSAPQLLAAAAVLAGLAIVARPRFRGTWLPLLVIPHFLVGLWIIKSSPQPHIDVFFFQRDSSAAILKGVNPYALTFPNIYGDGSPFYGPNLSINGRLQFGYPYPPLSLFFAVAGHLFGDYRFAQLVAIDGAALLMAYCRPGPLGPLAAVLYLYTPRGFFVLEQGWTEPYLVFLLAVTVFAACRARRALPIALGLFLAIKQYMIFALFPIVQLLRPKMAFRELARFSAVVGGTAFVVTVPLALWNVKAFVWDVVALQIHQPFRSDALSYLAWWAQEHPSSPPSAIAFAAALVATAIALLRFPRTPAGFAASISLVFLAFFAFNKQAFCNYYFFVIGALCTAIAAMAGEGAPARPPGAGEML